MNKRSSLVGLGKVYNFTLIQLFKNKANLISFGIMILFALAAPPLMIFIMEPETVTEEMMFYSEVVYMEDYLAGSSVGYGTRYGIQFGYSLVVMFIGVFSCTYIIRAIVEEKSSKLVETLMVSIKSQDMMLGKIFAVMTFIFVMLLLVVIAFAASVCVTSMFAEPEVLEQLMAETGLAEESLRIEPMLLLVVLVSLALAYLQFSLIAGLSGAGCSNIEDMEYANTSAMLLIMVGYFVMTFASAFGGGSAVLFSLCPLVSAYAAPAYYVIGDIGIVTLLISWLLQGICIFITLKLSGQVYDSLVMHKGKRLKLTQILSMASDNRKGVK